MLKSGLGNLRENPMCAKGSAEMGIYMDEPESLHLYTYCKNDGVNMVDPSGHWGKEESKTILKFHFQFEIKGK